MRFKAVLALVLGIVAIAACGCGAGSDAGDGTQPVSGAAAGGSHRGGNLVLLAKANADTGDPHVNYSIQFWQLYPITYDGLTAFAKEGDGLGERVVPDVATALPQPTDGGRTWTFEIRRGIRFSNGKELTPRDVKASFERIFRVKGPTASTFYGSIEGASVCLSKPAGCTLDRGVVVDDARRTVTFHLTHADPEFLQRLAVPHASILPASVPDKDVGTDVAALPATGPYYWAIYNPTKQVVLKRNRYFRPWSAEAQPDGFPDEITVRYGLQPSDQVTAIENGQGDYTFDQIPSDRQNEISTRYAEQVHVNQLAAVWYWALNTRIAPFDNLKARQALNYAFDRNTAILTMGGPRLGRATCQVLPPGFPGYKPYCPYTRPGASTNGSPWAGPDMARARRLVAESGTAGTPIDVVSSNISGQARMGEYMQTLLTQLGYRPRLKTLDDGIQYSFVQNSRNHVGAALEIWSQDYPAASDFLKVLLACDAYQPHSDASPNIGGFCDPAIDRQMARAARLQLDGDTAESDAAWAQVDRAVTDSAAWVSLYTPSSIDFVSQRLGGYNWSPTYLMLPSRVWVR